MNVIKSKRTAAFLLIFIAMFLISTAATAGYISNKSHMEYAQMEQLVLTRTNKVNNVISRLLYKTQVLSALVIQNNGQISDFERVAATVIDDPCIKNVILAPDGVVSHVYPMAGNEQVIGLDYFSANDGNREAIAAKDTGNLVLGGPFRLVQGGQALVGRLPVYLDEENGAKRFWGLVSVTLNYPQALDSAELEQLEPLGFAYEIWRNSPDTNERQIIANSPYAYNKNARYVEQPMEIFNADWYFRLSPIRNWYEYPETWIFSFVGLMISLLIAALVIHNYDLKRMKCELEKLNHCDPLTGILNRRGVFRELNSLIRDNDQKFSLCYLDLNKFKNINDLYGHGRGDAILQQFVQVIENRIDKHHIFARIGGDEFILIFKNMEGEDGISAFFEQIHDDINASAKEDSNSLKVSFSMGMAVYPDEGKSAEELIGIADNKMYQAKIQNV